MESLTNFCPIREAALNDSFPGNDIDMDACYRYTLSRQTSQGGFCYYMYRPWGVEEPNAPDTHAAVAILGLLDRRVPEVEHCAAWLQTLQDPSGGYPTLVIGYAAMKALQLLGARPLRDPSAFLQETAEIFRLTGSADLELADRLSDVRHCLELWLDHGLEVTEGMRQGIASALLRLRHEHGGYGAPGPNLRDTAAALALALLLDLPVDREVLAYARQCEGPPHGFNAAPVAVSSSLESQHAGLRVCCHFGARPRVSALVRNYVASCQTARGGFGRVPGAIAGLSETRCALEVLSMLAQGDAQAPEASGGA